MRSTLPDAGIANEPAYPRTCPFFIFPLFPPSISKTFCTFADVMQRTKDNYYIESKRLRSEVMTIAETLKEHPLRFSITNGISMDVEITKTDLKTIVSKNVGDDKFNAIKNALARDIPGYLAKAQYY